MSNSDDDKKGHKNRTQLNRSRLENRTTGNKKIASIAIFGAAVIFSLVWLFGRDGVDHNATVGSSAPNKIKSDPAATVQSPSR